MLKWGRREVSRQQRPCHRLGVQHLSWSTRNADGSKPGRKLSLFKKQQNALEILYQSRYNARIFSHITIVIDIVGGRGGGEGERRLGSAFLVFMVVVQRYLKVEGATEHVCGPSALSHSLSLRKRGGLVQYYVQ